MTKFATVWGASAGKSCTSIRPRLVQISAYVPFTPLAGVVVVDSMHGLLTKPVEALEELPLVEVEPDDDVDVEVVVAAGARVA